MSQIKGENKKDRLGRSFFIVIGLLLYAAAKTGSTP